MGDASDQSDVERFMRSEIGQKMLAAIRKQFQDRWIRDISFCASAEGITGSVYFHAGEPVNVVIPELTLARIHAEHEEVLEAAYQNELAKKRPKRVRKEAKSE
jgi:hypothetical protein